MKYASVIEWPTNQDLWDTWRQILAGREVWQGSRGTVAAQSFYESHKADMDAGSKVLWPEHESLAVCSLGYIYESLFRQVKTCEILLINV